MKFEIRGAENRRLRQTRTRENKKPRRESRRGRTHHTKHNQASRKSPMIGFGSGFSFLRRARRILVSAEF